MAQRIKGEPASQPGRRIAQKIGGIAMGHFVDHDGKDDNDDGEDN
jgi:hypothetical protein